MLHRYICQHPCIVVGLRSNGLAIVRALAREGVRVLAVDDRFDKAYAATRYCEKVLCPDLSGEQLVETLCELGRGLSQKGVLTLTMDRSVLLASEHRARLDPYYIFTMPEPAIVNLLMNKTLFQGFANLNGFTMPRSYHCSTIEALFEAARSLTMPCILKPAIKTNEFVRHAPAKAFFIREREELIQTYHLVSKWAKEVVVQEWIPGPDNHLIFCLYYFDKDSQPQASFTGRKIRQHIPYCGTACLAEGYDDPFVREDGIRLFQAIGYHGFAAVEYKKDMRDGSYKLIEPTVGRTEHIFALAVANGVNIPYIGYCDVIGLKQNGAIPRAPRIKYISWGHDFAAARYYIKHRELTLGGWLHSLWGEKTYALLAWDDLGPILKMMANRLEGVGRRGKRFIDRSARKLKQLGNSPLPPYNIRAGSEIIKDFWGCKHPVQEGDLHIRGALAWLYRAQDGSVDDGVSRAYCLKSHGLWKSGWEPAYPETTGYLIPTLMNCYQKYGDEEIRRRALRMADWECKLQYPDGGIRGETVEKEKGPVIFNTGQVIFGWVSAYGETGCDTYLTAAVKAADFLVRTQDPDGAWRRYSAVDASYKTRAYDTRTAWALLEVYKSTGREDYKETAVKNVEHALTQQHPNGWFQNNDLSPKTAHQPLLHTIAYAVEGLLACGTLLNNQVYVQAAIRPADRLITLQKRNGLLPGRFDSYWNPTVRWVCLTGLSQMAVVWLRLFLLTRDRRYLDAAQRANRFVKATQDLKSNDLGIRGGIKGSYPIYGRYGKYQYLNWAAKFFIDALLLEEEIMGKQR